MFIPNIAILTAGIFHEELLVLTQENCFCLLLTVCYLMLSTAKFCHLVGPLFWCLFITPLSNLSDMTGGPTVFREVDRSVKQIKFHLKSYLISDRKTGINSNNQPKSEVRNLYFETLSV